MPGQGGVVAAGHEVTVQAAAEILSDGGNAFDAVLAGLLTASIPEVVFSSLGGGGFLMAYTPENKETVLYDFFSQTPKAKRPRDDIDFFGIHADFGPATQEFHIGAGSTAVPGFIPGVLAIHKDLCRLPFKRITEPAIRVARKGVTITSFQAYLFTVIAPILTASKEARQLFAPSGKLLKAGDVYRNPNLASTMEALCEEGSRLFTEGAAAEAIVKQSKETGGHLTYEDLKNYNVIRRDPLLWRHRDVEIVLNPAPAASGPLIAFGLGFLEQLLSLETKPHAVHLAQAMAATNEARQAASGSLERIACRNVIAEHFNTLQNHTPAYRGTTHISVIDSQGNCASATVTNGEGNGLIVGDTGIMLNNMLGEEDLNPEGFHKWMPDTRLSTMMAPTILRHSDGALTVLGSGGSNRIRTAILQVAHNLIDRNMDLEEAVNCPRLHVERGGHLSFEDQLPEDERMELIETFPDAHAWPEPSLFFGGVHAARRLANGVFEGTGDPRRQGAAIIVTET